MILIVFVSVSSLLNAQNLIVNGSFEELTKKPKDRGEIYLAAPWVAGTKAMPDIYSSKAKNDDIKVPENMYGDEEPKDGENYAGLLLYSDREKMPRTYLTAKLKHKMLAGEYYCVKFHISFADLSKYAVNNIGALISHDSIANINELILDYEPQIINSTNRVFEKQWHWEDICRIYVADGGEEYITIGNFAKQVDVQKKGVKRPSGYTSSQFRDGYYYIDDISVIPNATPENCKCEPGNFAFANLNKDEAEFATHEKDVPDQVIISTTGQVHGEMPKEEAIHEDVVIQFATAKYNLTSAENTKLNEVVSFMQENSDVKAQLISHNDKSENVVNGLSKKRLDQVGKYLVSKGVADSRISSEDAADGKPIDTSGIKENRSQNMVVEIKFSK